MSQECNCSEWLCVTIKHFDFDTLTLFIWHICYIPFSLAPGPIDFLRKRDDGVHLISVNFPSGINKVLSHLSSHLNKYKRPPYSMLHDHMTTWLHDHCHNAKSSAQFRSSQRHWMEELVWGLVRLHTCGPLANQCPQIKMIVGKLDHTFWNITGSSLVLWTRDPRGNLPWFISDGTRDPRGEGAGSLIGGGATLSSVCPHS